MVRSLWLFMYVAAAATASTTAAIFEVTATEICCDSNSLEYAVQNAKAGDTIRINIDSSSGYVDPEYPWAYTIQLTSAHTQIILKAPRVVLDGLHQSTTGLNRTGVEDRPAVLLRGAPNNIHSSLVVVQPEANGVVIRGIGSVKGLRGLRIKARDVQVESGYFCNHQRVGIYVDREEAAGSVIGSNQPNSRPVIVSGNQKEGIYAHGANTTIRGVLAMGNTGTGIYIGGAGTVVGSEAVNVTTLVSNNGGSGISVNAENCSIRGVLVGTDITGKHAMGNSLQGIAIWNGIQTVIGSETGGVLTLISGNNGHGILACSSSTSIRGVLIGTDVTGVAALGNGKDGIQMCSNNDGSIVGSFIPSVKTVLSGNRRNGLLLGGGLQTKLIGVYAGVGKDGTTTVANSHHGILALTVTQFLKCAGTKDCSTIIGSIGAPPSVFSGNGGHGIESRTQSLDMVGTIYAGIGLDGGTPIPNGLDGVHIAGTGASTYIASGLVASGNHGGGLYIGAHSVFVENAYIGVDATGTAMVGNGGDGLFISESATSDVWVIGGIASGNGRSGVVVEGQGVHLDGMMVGLSTNGVSPLGNGRYGIEVGDYGTHFQVGAMVVPGFLLQPFRSCSSRNEICAASQLPCSNAKERDACAELCMLEKACVSFEWDTTSHACQLSTSCTMLTSGRFILGETWELWVRNRGELTRPTVISGNTLGGIIAAAQQMWLCNIRIGSSVEIGTTVAGSTRMNSGTGVTILSSATSTLVGTNSAFNSTQCTPVIKAYSEYGIHGAAPNLRIVSASIMENNRDGIYLETRATNAAIIASTIDQNGAANDGAGIRTRAQDTAIYNCTVGQSISRYYESQTNLGATPAGNKGVGVHIEAGATGTAIAGSTYIVGNGLVGIRDDTVSTESRNTYIDESTTHTDTNGWAQDACILCKCLPDSNMLTVVDCRPAAAGMDVRDFGPIFPTNLPTTLSELRISNVNLHTIEWDEVYGQG